MFLDTATGQGRRQFEHGVCYSAMEAALRRCRFVEVTDSDDQEMK